MRTFATAVLGLLFAAAFAAFFAAESVVAWAFSTPDVVATARDADLRGALLEAGEQAIERAAAREASPVAPARIAEGLREALEEIVPEGWFYEAVGQSHAGLVAYLEGGTAAAEVDLAEVKAAVRRHLRAALRAPALGAGSAAALEGASERLVAAIPDTVSMTKLVADAARAGEAADREAVLADLREGVRAIHTARAVGLVALVALFVVLVFVSMKTLRRLLVSVGVVLALAGSVYLAGMAAARAAAVVAVTKALHGDGPEAARRDERLSAAGDRLAQAVVARSTSRSDPLAYGAAGLGLALLVAGLAARPRA